MFIEENAPPCATMVKGSGAKYILPQRHSRLAKSALGICKLVIQPFDKDGV